MQPVGSEPLARWREAGEWWSHEPYREFVRQPDARGIVRETSREMRSLGLISSRADAPEVTDHREDWSLRPRKRRDEKVAVACGILPRETSTVAAPRYGQEVRLHTFSGYAFGRSAMLPEEIAIRAAEAGVAAVAITDPHSLVGAVEFVRACRARGIRPLVGASFEVPEGGELVLIARSKRGYQSLSQLISACHLDEPRGFPLATWERLERYAQDLLCLTGGDVGPLNRLVSRGDRSAALRLVERLKGIYGSAVYLEIERSELPWQIVTNRHLLELAEATGITPVAGGVVTHATREDFPVQDILTCADTLCTVDEVIGRKPPRDPSQPGPIVLFPRRGLNAERFLRDAAENQAVFADCPELLRNAWSVVEACDDEVLPARTRLPSLTSDPDHTLREITYAGAHAHYPQLTPAIRRRLEYELERIHRLRFSDHFLTAWDACRWAREQSIQMSGRGSVIDSAVAFCLGFSRIDAIRHRLHFDRFLPDDGSKRPDIDIDFEARRRDDVRNYLTRKYGRDHVATVAAVGAYCSRGIIREVGKAFGLTPEAISFLAKRVHGSVSPDQIETALDRRPELRASGISRERFQWVFKLAERMTDIPRNMRAHSSGVVISDRPLAETVPVMWSAAPSDIEGESGVRIIQWDKRSCKHYFDKFDLLCLRGQDVLAGTEERIRLSEKDFSVERLPVDDPETYRAMRSGELIGIPQSASPAMRQAHIRLRTQNLDDASLVQAGIRPGVGGAVKINTLIRRRRGLEPTVYSHPELERILGNTYGIVVFQEQIDQLLQAFGGYSSGEAEDLRDAIHKRRREDYGRQIKDQIVARIQENGFSPSVAEEVFELVAGFKGYGFAQGHALAFAEISIRSIWCQQNHPAEYFAALLSAQPAGYYGPCTLANEARGRGVTMLPPDVLRSRREFSVEEATEGSLHVPGAAMRVPLGQIHGLSEATIDRILAYTLHPLPEPPPPTHDWSEVSASPLPPSGNHEVAPFVPP